MKYVYAAMIRESFYGPLYTSLSNAELFDTLTAAQESCNGTAGQVWSGGWISVNPGTIGANMDFKVWRMYVLTQGEKKLEPRMYLYQVVGIPVQQGGEK